MELVYEITNKASKVKRFVLIYLSTNPKTVTNISKM